MLYIPNESSVLVLYVVFKSVDLAKLELSTLDRRENVSSARRSDVNSKMLSHYCLQA